ncbi:MAG TPA: PfkB family carbohydrate kinase [Planctomycetota bacterium]|nr:PfkB family carbohydrate kinase [Planctomycetota bacterium]
MKRILVVGDLTAEIVVSGLSGHPRPGREVFVSNARIEAGGGAARLAGALTRLGRNVTLVAKVGKDELGDLLLGRLKGKVGNVAASRDPKQRTSFSVGFADDGMSWVTYPGATAALSTGDLGSVDGRRYRHLHVASPFQLLGLALVPLFQRAKRAGLTSSLSVGGDPRGRWDLGDLAPNLDLLFLGEPEAKALGRATRTLAGEVPIVAVRRGERGAVAMTRSREWKAAGLAAGPVFDAAFLDGWLDGHRVEQVLAYAVAASSLSAEQAGQIGGTPTRAQALHHLGRRV